MPAAPIGEATAGEPRLNIWIALARWDEGHEGIARDGHGPSESGGKCGGLYAPPLTAQSPPVDAHGIP